ncbi:alpha-galactosidase [Reinekea blandensis]|uniref:Alpha-galactosidase n=1 Tax=Reinekea blandensis MED297 TaxID=314283 RepID=A4BGI0_9GAMM|nr:alpha-galactosidase [Reinekea blandensis]EAR08786.1 alpha-galactosidase [Reinekea sp. MED297] [Reinekea blandensis MED297]
MSDWLHLTSEHCSAVLCSERGGIPKLVYWGARLSADSDLSSLDLLNGLPHPAGYLDAIPTLSLVPEIGHGFHGEAGLLGHSQRQRWGGQMTLTSMQKTAKGEAEIVCRDPIAQLSLTLSVCLDPVSDVLTLQAELKNEGEQAFQLDHLGLSVPMPVRAAELMTFHGRWIQEFVTKRQRWPESKVVRESRRGKTAHDSFPALIAGESGFSDTQGEVWGLHLAWSGNHRLVAEQLFDGDRHIQLAEWLYPGEIELAPGDSYQTPTIVGSWSQNGLNALSQRFHRYLRQQVLDPSVAEVPRPVHLNTWEGIYFDHTPEHLLRMVDQAADMGVERFILDDGWFGARDDDHAGLGDWTVNMQKHPGGLHYLIDAVKARGMEFGLWFEPEMVNPDSDLYRAHPDWVLQVEDYEQLLGRYQYVLDLSRPEVSEYLWNSIDAILTEYDIRYIKWDMNRDLVQPGSGGVASVHRQTQALYQLMARIREAHPHVEIENCSSGGGRIDYGLMQHTQRIWLSDCIDALERQRMQYGASLFFPPEVLGSHLSKTPASTTNRVLNLGFRGITALFAHFGIELDSSTLTALEREEVLALVNLYKDKRALIHHGDFYRLPTGVDSVQAYGTVAENGEEALFAVATLSLPETMRLPPLRLLGLDAKTTYRLEFWIPEGTAAHCTEKSPLQIEGAGEFTGELLMQLGVQLPIMHPQSAMLISLTTV